MNRNRVPFSIGARLAVAAAFFVTGCTALSTQVLVDEKGRPHPPTATHCAGSTWEDNSMMALVPLPIIGLGMPTQEINEITADDVLSRCGPPNRLTNRHVEVDRTWCIPTVFTRVFSLGVWHWCPANVEYDADVLPPPSPPNAALPPAASLEPESNRYEMGTR